MYLYNNNKAFTCDILCIYVILILKWMHLILCYLSNTVIKTRWTYFIQLFCICTVMHLHLIISKFAFVNLCELHSIFFCNRQVNNLLAYAGFGWLSYIVPSFIRFPLHLIKFYYFLLWLCVTVNILICDIYLFFRIPMWVMHFGSYKF